VKLVFSLRRIGAQELLQHLDDPGVDIALAEVGVVCSAPLMGHQSSLALHSGDSHWSAGTSTCISRDSRQD